jgi:tRNA threonylcarbamoyladenosine biosynthesis protein TsaB
MRVLAFDTSTSVTAVALLDGERVLVEDERPNEERHGDVLLPRVRELLARAGVALASVELIAVGIGPGSFTGLRIGLATAKGLGLASGVPIRGVCSLRALAAGAGGDAELCVAALDAGKGEVFAGVFARGEDGCEPRLGPLRALPEAAGAQLAAACASAASVAVAGTGVRRYPQLLAALGPHARRAATEHDTPHGRFVAKEALALLRRDGASELARLEPSYLRESL